MTVTVDFRRFLPHHIVTGREPTEDMTRSQALNFAFGPSTPTVFSRVFFAWSKDTQGKYGAI